MATGSRSVRTDNLCLIPLPLSLVAFGSLVQLISLVYLLIIERNRYDSPDEHHSSLIQFFMVLGIAMTVKIAIYPQVLPFIVKDEMRIESAIAYNQSMDHLLTSLSLLSVGLFS